MNICKICNQEFKYLKFLSLHIKQHNITTKNYYDLYLKEGVSDGICPNCKKQCNFCGLGGYTKYCSLKCASASEENKLAKKHTHLLKYGVDHPSKTKEFQEKRKCSCLRIYGVEHQSKSSKIKEKKRQTNLINRGVDNPFKSEIIKNQIKQTNLKNIGCEYPSQSEAIKEKSKISILKHYGVMNASQDPSIKEKKQCTCFKNYGVRHPGQSKIIRTKSIITLKNNYGVEIPYQSSIIKNRGKSTCLENYGVDNYAKTLEFREFARGQMIDAIEAGLKDGKKFTPRKGNNELPFIAELQKHTSYFIDNDARILNYFPDGYIKELNFVTEWDEIDHERVASKIRDNIKDESYNKAGLIVFRIKEKDWKTNKKPIIEYFIFLTKQNQLENELRKIKTDSR